MSKEYILKLIKENLNNQEIEELYDDLKNILKIKASEDIIKFAKEEKIKLFMSYFKGRDDVYPYLAIDKKDSSKKYYIPSCLNEWKKGVCTNMEINNYFDKVKVDKTMSA